MKDNSNNNKLNNNNPLSNNVSSNDIHPNGRKLIEDFNKFKNETNTINNNNNNTNHINNNKNNNDNISSNYNISNDNFSFLIPIKKKKEIEKKTEIISANKIIICDNNINNNNNHNIFFTDYGLGYRCNCQKTQCNKYYCQCFRENRYCFNCNCVGSHNQKPDFFSTNKHKIEEENNKKNNLITCTCTKSSCSKNYCECFKNKVKCNSLCRCINCDNCEEENFFKNKNILDNYKCCLANSIFIIKNKIFVEDINNGNDEKSQIKSDVNINIIIDSNWLSSFSSDKNENIIGHKRKRNNYIDNETIFQKSKLNDENRDKSTKNKNNLHN